MRKLSDLPEEMVLDDQVKQRILRNGKAIAQKRRKQARLRNGILVGAVVIASIVFPLSNEDVYKRQGYIHIPDSAFPYRQDMEFPQGQPDS